MVILLLLVLSLVLPVTPNHRVTSLNLELAPLLLRTGTVSLNGNTSVSGSNTFTVGTGATTLGGTLGVTGATTINNTLTITPNNANGIQIQPYGASPGNTSELQFYELSANGSDYTGFKAPDSLTSNIVYTLPNQAAASNNYVLTYQSGGVLQWESAAQLGSVITGRW